MNIIVNGGTKGIGREVVNCLARDKENIVFVTGRDQTALSYLTSSLRNVITMTLDISELDSRGKDYSDKVKSHFSRVDILINMAGLMIPRPFMEIKEEEARKMLDTNFFGPATAIRLLKPLMGEGSHIVNISSMGGFQGSSKYPGLAYYSASKAAIACLTECLAGEFSQDGIMVNCLALGAVGTEMFEEAFPGYKAPVTAAAMGEFVADFALNGQRLFNGKILPVAAGNP